MPFFFSISHGKKWPGIVKAHTLEGFGVSDEILSTHTYTHRHIHTHEGWVNLRQRMIKDYLIAIAKVIDIPSVSDSAVLAKRMKCNLMTLRACHVVDTICPHSIWTADDDAHTFELSLWWFFFYNGSTTFQPT